MKLEAVFKAMEISFTQILAQYIDFLVLIIIGTQKVPETKLSSKSLIGDPYALIRSYSSLPKMIRLGPVVRANQVLIC